MTNNHYQLNLGELEADIMEIIWEQGDSTVRSVLAKLNKKKAVAYTTVMTVMSRLCEKGVLKRKADASGAYIYSAPESRDDFFARLSGDLIVKLLKNYGDLAIARFLDIVNGKEFKQSNEWRKKIKKIIK